MFNDPNDKPFEMKPQEPSDIGDNTPVIVASAETEPEMQSPAQGPKTDRALWMTIGGITITACCVVFVLVFNFLRSDPFANLFTGYDYDTPTPFPTVSARDMTATQRAWTPPSAQPTFASVAEAKKAAEDDVLMHVENFAEGYPFQPDINQPGDVYLYNVFLSAEQTAILDYGWCTTTQEVLDQNFAQMKVEFIVNGKVLDNDQLAIHEYNRSSDNGRCRVFTALITHWPSGQHHLDVNVTFLKPTDDGWNVYPAGTHTFRYYVNVR
jgi:hypothetical protein